MSRREELLRWLKNRAAVEDIRTFWINKDPELLEIVENIVKLEVRFGIRSEVDSHAATRRRAA